MSMAEISRLFLSVPAETPIAASPPRLDDPSLFINRELSWLEFNARVLAESADDRVPLYERLKFVAIFAANLDEFFMVRVAGLQAQLSGDIEEVAPDGKTPDQQLGTITNWRRVFAECVERARTAGRPRRGKR